MSFKELSQPACESRLPRHKHRKVVAAAVAAVVAAVVAAAAVALSVVVAVLAAVSVPMPMPVGVVPAALAGVEAASGSGTLSMVATGALRTAGGDGPNRKIPGSRA